MKKTISQNTVVPIGVAFSIVAGVLAGYITFYQLHSSMKERVASLEGRVNGMEGSTKVVLAALEEHGNGLYWQRANMLATLDSMISRILNQLENWNAPTWQEVIAGRADPTFVLRLPTGVPINDISTIAFHDAFRTLPNPEFIASLDTIGVEIADFNTLMNGGLVPPPGPFGMMAMSVSPTPRFVPATTEPLHLELVAKCHAKREFLKISLRKLQDQARVVRAETLSKAQR
jgi:hypothetical protein